MAKEIGELFHNLIYLKKEEIERAEREFSDIMKKSLSMNSIGNGKLKHFGDESKILSGSLSLTPRNPSMENEKIFGGIHTFGGITSFGDFSGITPSLTNQFNDNRISLYGWYKPEYTGINDFERSGCVLLYIRPKDSLSVDEQILLTVNFISHTKSNIKLFVGMKLVREEDEISGEHSIAILADRPDVSIIHFFLKPEPIGQDPATKTMISFIGAEIYTI